MNTANPALDAPTPIKHHLKNLGRALREFLEDGLSDGIAIIASFLLLILFVVATLAAGETHGEYPDAAFVLLAWIAVVFATLHARDLCHERRFVPRSQWAQGAIDFLGNLAIGGVWLLWLPPLVLALLWTTTSFQFNPESNQMARVRGIVLSPENPSVRAWPWQCERVPIRHTYTATVMATAADGQKLSAKIEANLTLGKDPSRWPWQSKNGYFAEPTPAIVEALTAAFQQAVGARQSRTMSREPSLDLEIDTGLALKLEEAGLALPGTVSVKSIEPYFE